VEPERHIEKELKAFAEKRRAAVGAPAGLSPARRKSLLEQAERLAKAGAGETRPWWQIFWSSWPRLAVAGVTVAAVAAVIWFLLPMPEAQHKNIQSSMALARNNAADFKKVPFEAAKNAPNPVATPALQPPSEPTTVAATDKGATKLTSPALDEINGYTLKPAGAPLARAPATVFAASPPPATVRMMSPATARREGKASNADDSALFDNGGIDPETARRKNATLTLSPNLYGDIPTDAPVAPVIQSFHRADLRVTTGSVGGIVVGANLLVSFRVEQSLGKLRMIDKDGSVYEGFVAQKPEIVKPPVATLKSATAKDRADLATAGGGQTPATRLYRFRVSGTNRTLKEEIVFTGDFLTSGGAPAPQPAVVTNAPESAVIASEASGELLPLELRGARLEGRLLLGKTNNVEIHAAPVKN
jgi:hypothetical protein